MSENAKMRKPGGKGGAAGIVREIAETVADELGYYVWDVEYVKEGARRILRITIDNEEGITIDDCEKFHRTIDPKIDEADPIEESYYLEVSSPGIERELKTPMHISACEGWQVEVKLYAPVNGTKVFKGTLCECPEGKIIIENGEGTLEFEAASVAKINTVYDFGADD
jgi:ribosome maturation factor RimP